MSWAGETTAVAVLNIGLAVFVLIVGWWGAQRDKKGLWSEWTTGPRLRRFGSIVTYFGVMVLVWLGLRGLLGVFV